MADANQQRSKVGLIVSIMVSAKPSLTLLRDSVHAVVMLVLHGLAGVCIVVGAFRDRESECLLQ